MKGAVPFCADLSYVSSWFCEMESLCAEIDLSRCLRCENEMWWWILVLLRNGARRKNRTRLALFQLFFANGLFAASIGAYATVLYILFGLNVLHVSKGTIARTNETFAVKRLEYIDSAAKRHHIRSVLREIVYLWNLRNHNNVYSGARCSIHRFQLCDASFGPWNKTGI